MLANNVMKHINHISIETLNASNNKIDHSIGRDIAVVRKEAGMTQAQLSQAVTFSTATLSRIESGEKSASAEEVAELLKAIGTPKAMGLSEFWAQNWDKLDRPHFDHPSRPSLWEANLALRKLADLRLDPHLTAVFLRQIDLYENEIRRVAVFLASRDHQIACAGSIGVGKSTAICKLTGLLKPGEDKLDRQIVLETGAGGVTLCEVHISQGPRYGLRIVPRTEDSIRRDVEDFCDYLITTVRSDTPTASEMDDDEGDPLGISKEVVRAIRNMADLTEKKKEEAGRRVRIDPAKELAKQFGNTRELCIHILTKMDLLRRNRRDEWYPENYTQSPMHWLQDLFSAVNNGRHPEFTLPEKIEVVVPEPVLNSRELPIRIIDTKGIDQTAERQDLECHFDDPRTILILCSRFNDAPEVALQTLLRRAKEARARDIELKTIVLVLPRPDEALAVKYDDGTRVDNDNEGYDLKRDQIHFRLNQQGLAGVAIEFFNAREEGGNVLRDRLIEKIIEHRRHYADLISRLSESVNRLDENREDEQVRLVFEHVMSDLSAWISSNRTIDLSKEGVQKPLIGAIDATRYASTVRAAVRRFGDWDRLDYYHHLAFGVRKLAVDQIGSKIDDFKVIANNLMTNEGLAPAKEFLQGVINRIDSVLDEAYRRIQSSGRETFKQTLAENYLFWNKCEERWGKGSGYRAAIRDMTDEELERNCDEAQTFIVNMLDTEWEGLVSVLENMLQATKAPMTTEAG